MIYQSLFGQGHIYNIGNLSQLRRLYLDGNSISSIPSELWNLSNLELLTLSRNNINSLPAGMTNLSSIQHIWAGSNDYTTMPVEIFNLPSLQELRLESYQPFIDVPNTIGSMSNLRILSLSNTGVNSFPSSIGNLKNIEVLIFTGDNNAIDEIGQHFDEMLSLWHLNINYSSFSSPVSSFIGDLPNVTQISLFGNYSSLPPELANLNTLTSLRIGSGNMGNLYSAGTFNQNSSQVCQSGVGVNGETVCVQGNGTTIDITFTP
ncbi:protein phosphatase 1 regulatory subunit 42 [Candidatus Gracilibacteria bacterium]|nr:protein phosphatase 1 regulatory subunit 42 [Candidatus Gracilibacteria bacterium]